MNPRLLPSGPHALLAEYESLDQVMRVMRRLESSPPAGLVDVVPAARTILVTVRDDIDLGSIAPMLSDGPGVIEAPGAALPEAPLLVLEVVYDGEDLGAVADACGTSTDDVVARHCTPEYTVAFCGFVPGFSYLVGLDPRLHLPRRPTPRTRVRAGTVAIASEFTAVYPTAGPGGWHLLGSTTAVMWDEQRAVPALLPPRTRVRFVRR